MPGHKRQPSIELLELMGVVRENGSSRHRFSKKKQRELKEAGPRWAAPVSKGNPVTAVRNYFGERAALYYLWLVCTYLLISAVIGMHAVFLIAFLQQLTPQFPRLHSVWTDVLEAIGVLAVIANGLVIGISSDFIPRLVYQYRYGPCANGTVTDIDCMVGYINNTLSIARIDDQSTKNDFSTYQMMTLMAGMPPTAELFDKLNRLKRGTQVI
ncbi:anoctamin-9-like isoform X1 [Lates japonicus]|uniref:Anoctamin-9-like isoform X1 n=1 Tax=Lates japonicus TaxID=270547 RepID=A0AAD3MS98_LATJO|nr:anoctamin-9-like isoform X1 [Lates japonicus]